MTNNINHLRKLVDQAWVKHSKDHFRSPTAHDMEILIKTCLMPLAFKTQNDSFAFVHELKQEMHADLKTSNVNAVCATCGKCVFNSNHDAYVSKYLNDVNARTKKPKNVQLIIFIVDSGCTKHMTGNISILCNFVEKYLGTVRFGNDQFAPILGYGDLVQGNITINRVYYIEGLNNNLFSVGQFCNADLEVAFWKSTCFVRDLQGNDLLTGNCGSDLYTISLQETTSSTPICLMAKASPTQAWIPKPSVLGKPAPFSDSLERKKISKKKSVPKTNESEGLSKPVTLQNLPQTAMQATRNTQMKDKVVPNISQVKYKKTEVEDHHRISSISNQTKSVTACNDSLKSRTSNVNVVCATCGKCVFNSNHDACVSKYLNDVNARTKKPKVVPISTRKPKSQANKSVATHRKKTVASKSIIQNSKSYYRMQYEKTGKAWKWWIEQQCPSGYKWVPKTKMKWVPKVRNETVKKRVSFAIDNASRITNIVQLILFIVDSGCTKHMTGNISILCNFVEKYMGTICFSNDQFASILGFGDLVQGNIMINRVYYVKCLNHNLFSIGQFCDADLEVAFQKGISCL
ncbi:hypothetical protein Tco_1157154 [Tanacetum coccineum]